MTARRLAQEGASAPSNVVRLPTAAARKVRQPRSVKAWEAADELPHLPFNRPVDPEERRSLGRALLIRDMERTPELCIATAIYRTLDDMQRLRVQAQVATMATRPDSRAACQALAWLEVFDDADVARETNYALKMLERGEWE